jgi:hypothetical protein
VSKYYGGYHLFPHYYYHYQPYYAGAEREKGSERVRELTENFMNENLQSWNGK